MALVMSDTTPQSVSSGCRKYVKSKIKFNTFNTFSNVKKYKHTIMMILLVIAAIIAGYGFICFMVEHVFLSLLMVFCISCALAVEREV